MHFRWLFLGFIMLLFSCETERNTNVSKNMEIEEKFLDSIDLYPLYPGCDNFYEKEKQLACFQQKFSKFVQEQLDRFYKDDFKNLSDTLWIKFSIDSLGQTHFMKITHGDSLQLSQKTDSIFFDIARMIPTLKPAIFQDKPVEVQFKIPVITEK